MKYLFGCEYDNEIYYQTENDKSLKNSEKSSFYDVVDKEIRRFWLDGNGHNYLVDLRDGHFEIDGVPFKMHEEELSDFRIIYYRKHTRQFCGTDEINHEIEFCVGWQTNNENGENIKQILTIK